jgi:TRAP-type C4-dicarboxylate transport system permease small subunit
MKIFNKIFDTVGVIFFAGMVFVVLLQIACRFFLKINVPWTEEMSRLLFIFLCFFGTAVAYREKEMIVIDFIISKFKNKFRTVISAGISFFVLSFFVILLLGSIMMLKRVWPTSFSTMDKVSTGWIYIPPIIACSAIVIWAFAAFVQKLRRKS